MCFTFKKNNKQTTETINCFLKDDTNAGVQALQTSIKIKLCQNPWDGLILRLLNIQLLEAAKCKYNVMPGQPWNEQ